MVMNRIISSLRIQKIHGRPSNISSSNLGLIRAQLRHFLYRKNVFSYNDNVPDKKQFFSCNEFMLRYSPQRYNIKKSFLQKQKLSQYYHIHSKNPNYLMNDMENKQELWMEKLIPDGLEPIIDKQKLVSNYRRLQKKYHPDNKATGDIEKSSSINVIFKEIMNPASRVKLLLKKRYGINVEEKGITSVNNDYLEYVFSLMRCQQKLRDEKLMDLQNTMLEQLGKTLDSGNRNDSVKIGEMIIYLNTLMKNQSIAEF